MKKVSIITPLYNKDKKYIEACANLLERQIYSDFEWIIVLNEIESEIDVLLHEIKKKFDLKIIIDKSISNVAIARNKGIMNSEGDYLYFMDIDDYIHEHTLYCLVETMKHSSADFVLGSLKKVNVKPSFSTSYGVMMDRLVESRNIKAKSVTRKKMRASCLNILYDMNFILDNRITFNESLSDLSDITFTMPAYEKSTNIVFDKDAQYLKLRRNDAVQFPSLSQRSNRALLYPRSFSLAMKELDSESQISAMLRKRLLYSYHHRFFNSLYDGELDDNRIILLEEWSKAFLVMKLELFYFNRKIHNFEIKNLVDKNFYKAQKIARIRSTAKKIKKMIKKPKTSKRILYLSFLSKKLSVKPNWILYESFLGKNYSDSPKYIYEYLSKEYPDAYKHIWVFNENEKNIPFKAVKVKRFSFKHLYFMARSKFLVNNMRQPLWYVKRQEQIFLETWHGTPLKKLVFDMDDIHSANPNYKLDFYEQSRSWDYLVSANKFSTEVFKRAFLYDNEILEYGYPRNDLLYSSNKDEISLELKQKLGLPIDKKIVLYAPTWRDDEYYKPGQYKFKLTLDLERLREELGKEYFFIIRTHYFIADHLDLENVSDFVYNGSKYDDISELYLLSDILITDYSSVFFDYANLKRPILFFTYDLEKYRDTLRGFYIDLKEDGPGPLIMNNDELINVLKNIDQVNIQYKDRLEKFHNLYCDLDDGQASKRISERVIINSD
ncbi:CDP-glycerol glycerophosphotransferase family protein [Alkalicoccobacillus plakortidis]|uniref:Bifunctional glycosyltransferase family 2 protein/CDP-glycerol:glycerophosphate glycerophosphotransferase n=1 Tax=Alkalicoccobacillus plakortidis TaxID=444060 RepID=A0ABT0XJ30_9BACI|nr:bifunctional glycosyltransferase family 2 protein/CDP-glycerol:glycerophosphate glycerophosphotransferase [Alkalicoccobacillus plakortidis]MCM2675730.1 bifunctional glycosyltransferase family 2 protein/CDP-glycerol:glycerophosphate glycerophosphotransferase [Alkalicoccobacillus plakortidis]